MRGNQCWINTFVRMCENEAVIDDGNNYYFLLDWENLVFRWWYGLTYFTFGNRQTWQVPYNLLVLLCIGRCWWFCGMLLVINCNETVKTPLSWTGGRKYFQGGILFTLITYFPRFNFVTQNNCGKLSQKILVIAQIGVICSHLENDIGPLRVFTFSLMSLSVRAENMLVSGFRISELWCIS